MRPAAASTMMRPVGVGLTSRGPTGAAGLTITTGIASFLMRIEHRLLRAVFDFL